MANYQASALAKAQAKVTQKWGAPEKRSITPSLVGLALQNMDIAIPKAEQLRVHENRVVDINYFTKIAAGNTTAKAAAHTGTKGDSAKVNLTYVTHVEKFSVNAKLANNNIFAYEEILQNQIEQAWNNLFARHNASAVAFLENNRLQLAAASVADAIAASGAGYWNDTNKTVEIAAANEATRLQLAEQFIMARYMTGMYDCVADLQTWGRFKFLMNQGAGNNQNLAGQFGNSSIVPSQAILTSNYSAGAFYLMPKGGFAGVVWNDKLNKDNTKYDATTGLFTTMADPFGYGAVADVSVYSGRVDSSADTVGGSTQDVKDEYEMTLTIAYAAAPLSTANDSVITQFAIVP